MEVKNDSTKSGRARGIGIAVRARDSSLRPTTAAVRMTPLKLLPENIQIHDTVLTTFCRHAA
jgi:hypothetical protein